MNQILTIFRAEGPQAQRLLSLCRTTRKSRLSALREAWRKAARFGTGVSAYVEYRDGWSMGSDYIRVMGSGTRRREMASGELLFRVVTNETLSSLRRQLRRKHQFAEQAAFLNVIAALSQGSGIRGPVALAVFRDILGASITDEELEAGSNNRFHAPPKPASHEP